MDSNYLSRHGETPPGRAMWFPRTAPPARIGTDKSKRFYDAALEPLGYKCLRAARSLLCYGYGRDSIALWVVQAERPVPADEKSGLHFCFAAPDTAAVDALHSAAMASGGHDNDAPGLRPIYGPDYYTAFIIDPDGYRIEAYYGPAET